jgi:hypothetical protein
VGILSAAVAVSWRVRNSKMARKTLIASKSISNLSPIRQHGLEVDIPTYEEMDGGSYVNFVIQITKEGIDWEVRKRYSEFKFFQQALAEHTQHLNSEFPPKTVNSLFLHVAFHSPLWSAGWEIKCRSAREAQSLSEQMVQRLPGQCCDVSQYPKSTLRLPSSS